MLANLLSRYWWMTLLRGVIWILFGILVFAEPGISLVAMTFMFGIFALCDGIGNVVSAIGGRNDGRNWWVLLLAGLLGIGVGICTFLMPGITALTLLYFIALWAIATGVLEVIAAFWLRKEIQGEFWLALAGLISIFFGVMIVAQPGAGALSVLWLIGGYAVVFGAILIGLAFTVRRFASLAVLK